MLNVEEAVGWNTFAETPRFMLMMLLDIITITHTLQIRNHFPIPICTSRTTCLNYYILFSLLIFLCIFIFLSWLDFSKNVWFCTGVFHGFALSQRPSHTSLENIIWPNHWHANQCVPSKPVPFACICLIPRKPFLPIHLSQYLLNGVIFLGKIWGVLVI